MAVTNPITQPQYPLVLQQSSSFSSIFIFGQGKVSLVTSVTSGASPTVTVKDAHCLSIGQLVHLAVADDCCQLRLGCYEVTAVTDAATVNLRLVAGQAVTGQADALGVGWITRAINLDGFTVRGAIASRNPNTVSPPNLVGSIASGDDSILVNGDVSVVQNDTLTFSAAGLENVRVKGVFKSYASTTATTATNTVIVVDGQASATVTVDSPQKFSIVGGVLANFTFSFDGDPRCGRVVGSIDPKDLADILLPTEDCCDSLILIGCYQIALLCGDVAPRASYPRSSYVSWARTFASGSVYMRAGFIGI